MPNKTIYVSEEDLSLFDQAKEIAGEALSSVIARALREFVTRHQAKEKRSQEITVLVGPQGAQREQRFFGTKTLEWKGFSTDREWWMSGNVYSTQKGNIAVYMQTICKASLLTDKKKWKESGDYLVNQSSSELVVAPSLSELQSIIPQDLFIKIANVLQKEEKPVEYLDI